MTTQDSAEKRKNETIAAEAARLSPVIQYLRQEYPAEKTTAEIVEALGMDKKDVLAELHNSPRKREGVGAAHGNLNTAVWQYKPTSAETKWKPEYNSR